MSRGPEAQLSRQGGGGGGGRHTVMPAPLRAPRSSILTELFIRMAQQVKDADRQQIATLRSAMTYPHISCTWPAAAKPLAAGSSR